MNIDEVLEKLRKYDSFIEEKIEENKGLMKMAYENPLFPRDKNVLVSNHQNTSIINSFRSDILIYCSVRRELHNLFPELRKDNPTQQQL